MNNLLSDFQIFMQNPVQALIARRIPQDVANDPNKAIQYLMDTGKVSQEQYNAAQQYIKMISQAK